MHLSALIPRLIFPIYTTCNDVQLTHNSLVFFSVYVDGSWYGEVKSHKLGNKQGYQFILNDLNPEQSYDISVKAIAGFKRVDPDAQHVFCLSEGPMSNVITVMAPAAPKSPKLRLEGLTPEGIDVTWQAPQQHGDATISVSTMLCAALNNKCN